MRLNSFQIAKASQGFIGANNRPACRNCKHLLPETFMCGRGGFFTSSWAVCELHAAGPAPARAKLAPSILARLSEKSKNILNRGAS